MKHSGVCPKCSGTEVYTDSGQSKMGDRCSIPVTSWKHFNVDVYVCTACGYVEEYMTVRDLQSPDLRSKLLEKWRRV